MPPIQDNKTLFRTACEEGNATAVRLMLDSNDIIGCNSQTQDGKTPFYLACEKGNREVVEILLAESRISHNARTHEWETPFFIACKKNHSDIVALMVGNHTIDINMPTRGQVSPFYIACEKNNHAVVAVILSHNIKQKKVAAEKGMPECGVVRTDSHACGRTPIEIARKNKCHDIVAMIKNYELNIAVRNEPPDINNISDISMSSSRKRQKTQD